MCAAASSQQPAARPNTALNFLNFDLQEEAEQAPGVSRRSPATYLALWFAEVGPPDGIDIGGGTNVANGLERSIARWP